MVDSKKIGGCSWFSLWKGIMGIKALFQENIKLKLGNGSKLSFWSNKWASSKLLKEVYL